MEQKFSNNSLDLETLREFCKREDAEADSYLSRPLMRERMLRTEGRFTSRAAAMASSFRPCFCRIHARVTYARPR